jgi:hypothetical protein
MYASVSCSTPGRYPVIVTHGPYGKDVAWQTAEPYKDAWQKGHGQDSGPVQEIQLQFHALGNA